MVISVMTILLLSIGFFIGYVSFVPIQKSRVKHRSVQRQEAEETEASEYINKTAPAIVSETLNGESWYLEDQRDKVVVVFFWSILCASCVDAVPAMNNIYLKYANDEDFLLVGVHRYPEKEFIARALDHDKIILGICFGAQLLAEALGGKVFTSQNKEIGWHEVILTPQGQISFLFQNIPKQFMTFHWHADHFSLPPDCTRLAYSNPTPNQAYISKVRPLAGIQFHPEYTLALVRFFARECSDEWQKDLYATSPEEMLAQTEKIPDTYWLMAQLLENMDREFAATA